MLNGRGLVSFLLGMVFAVVAAVMFLGVYFKWGHVPVAVADKAFPFEKEIVQVPLQARINRELQKPPYAGSEDAYQDGALVYKDYCASCHGAPGEDSDYAKWMYPVAPQLWKKHAKGDVVGVSDDEVNETYWKVKNGIRLTGMPAFQHVLSDEEMWDVSLLLKAADQKLPDDVEATLVKRKR